MVVERPRADSGLPAGARPYGPGDSRRLVHWRATAHAGSLMVKELERPSAEPTVVTVDLPQDPDAAERVAERALGIVVDLLQRGSTVLLATLEPSGRVVALVANRRVAGRRLARAVAPGAGSGAPGTAARVSVVEAIRRANRSGPPEHSVRLRAACLGTVLVAVGAGASLGEIAPATAVAAGVLITAGMTFSYVTRTRPPGWIKVVVAVGAVAAFAWFFHSVSAPAVDFTSVLDPLTPPARLRAGRALLPRALPARPPVLARCVGGPDGRRRARRPSTSGSASTWSPGSASSCGP